jgi:hypothetical protein
MKPKTYSYKNIVRSYSDRKTEEFHSWTNDKLPDDYFDVISYGRPIEMKVGGDVYMPSSYIGYIERYVDTAYLDNGNHRTSSLAVMYDPSIMTPHEFVFSVDDTTFALDDCIDVGFRAWDMNEIVFIDTNDGGCNIKFPNGHDLEMLPGDLRIEVVIKDWSANKQGSTNANFWIVDGHTIRCNGMLTLPSHDFRIQCNTVIARGFAGYTSHSIFDPYLNVRAYYNKQDMIDYPYKFNW